MEKTDEVYGEGNEYTTEFRQYDPRIGRWMSLDPEMLSFPWQSPFVAFDNNPIFYTDPNGAAASPGGPKTDEVRKGEGVWSVAHRNNVTMEQIAEWNPSTFPKGLEKGSYMLHPGMKLVVSDPNKAIYSSAGNSTDQMPVASPTEANSNNNGNAFLVAGSTINGVLSLSTDAVKELGGLDNATKLIESGKFEALYNGATKSWSLKFFGNQHVSAEFVSESKATFIKKANAKLTTMKVLKVAGTTFNIVGVALTANDIRENGLNWGNGADAAAGAYAFIPGYGWIVAGIYFGIDATIGKEEFLMWHNEGMKHWEYTRKHTGWGFWEHKKAGGD